MKTKSTINKSQAIRDQFSKVGANGRNKDIIAALKAKGIVVTPAQVSNVRALSGKLTKKQSSKRAGEAISERLQKFSDRLKSSQPSNDSAVTASRMTELQSLTETLNDAELVVMGLMVSSQMSLRTAEYLTK